MKRLLLIILIINFAYKLPAQTVEDLIVSRPQNNINFNLGGDASTFSLSYERLFFIKPWLFLSGGLGLSYGREITIYYYNSNPRVPPRYLTIPHQVTGNIGKGRHFFEVGLGNTLVVGPVYPHYLTYGTAGYRFQPIRLDQLNFRLFGSLLFNSPENFRDVQFIPLGISIGVTF